MGFQHLGGAAALVVGASDHDASRVLSCGRLDGDPGGDQEHAGGIKYLL